jgi:hypothetical protein
VHQVEDQPHLQVLDDIVNYLVRPGPVEDPRSGVDAVPRETITQRRSPTVRGAKEIFTPLLAMPGQLIFVEGDPIPLEGGTNSGVFYTDREH